MTDSPFETDNDIDWYAKTPQITIPTYEHEKKVFQQLIDDKKITLGQWAAISSDGDDVRLFDNLQDMTPFLLEHVAAPWFVQKYVVGSAFSGPCMILDCTEVEK